jgi:cytochrome c553
MGWKTAAISLVLSCSAMADTTSTQALGAAGIDPTATRLNYMLNCQGCHAADGRGLNDIPAMADFVGNFLSVDGGRAYLVQVPGSANSPLSDQDLANVLNWILLTMSAAQLPQPFTLYSAEEVAGFRQQPLADAAATRARLLTKFTDG